MPATASLQAAIFDVDGTLVDSERDGHRVAFNTAFQEFGLPDHWDEDHYGELLHITGGGHRLNAHLEQRGMAAAEREALVPRLHRRKTELFQEMVGRGAVEARPGVRRLIDELDNAGVRLAVATTGTRSWVQPLLDHLFGAGRFEVVITAKEAPDRKPDPSAYLLTLDRLDLGAAGVVAVEDSRNGLVAARAAGLRCAVVVNDYSRDQDFEGADLVLDSFGDEGATATVLSDPHGLGVRGRLDLEVLRRLAVA